MTRSAMTRAGPGTAPTASGSPRVRPVPWLAGERGGATLVGLALVGLILAVGVVAVDVGALAGARAAAQTAADLAALAALTPTDAPAAAPGGSGPGRARAAEIAAANGADLVACDSSAAEAVVTVRRRVQLAPGGLAVTLVARARAVLAPRRA
jgi:secretion/DNA translocation related TadE-like protein